MTGWQLIAEAVNAAGSLGTAVMAFFVFRLYERAGGIERDVTRLKETVKWLRRISKRFISEGRVNNGNRTRQ